MVLLTLITGPPANWSLHSLVVGWVSVRADVAPPFRQETGEYNHKDVAKWTPIKKQNIYKSVDGKGEKAELE